MNKSMIPQDIDGFRSESINGILKCLRALWPLQSATIMHTVTASGTHYDTVRNPPQKKATTVKKPFDISDTTTGGDLKLTIYLADTKAFAGLRGAVKSVAAGTGWTFTTPLYTTTLTAATLVYLKYARATAAVTIEKTTNTAEATFITPDDYSYKPLWYIEWASSAIDVENSIDLRESYIIEGIS